jgi:hypothetical protein
MWRKRDGSGERQERELYTYVQVKLALIHRSPFDQFDR